MFINYFKVYKALLLRYLRFNFTAIERKKKKQSREILLSYSYQHLKNSC